MGRGVKSMSKKPLIVLIGGPPSIGKTSLATKLASAFNFELYSTDFIITIFEFILSPEIVKFMRPPTYESWRTIKDTLMGSDDPTIEGFKHQLVLSSIVINSFIKSAVGFEKSVILEGVHLVPGFINLNPYGKQILYMILSIKDDEELKRRYYTPKGIYGRDYLPNFPKGQEDFLRTLKIKNYIENLAVSNGIELIEDNDFETTCKILSEKISKLLFK